MLENLRTKLNNSTLGKGVMGVVVLIAIALAILSVASNTGQSSASKQASDRVYICAETGKQFTHTLQRGESQPILSPYSGKNTGFEAESCFWTSDGKVKKEPTYVLLNRNKGVAGPTFCPDCGRLVVQYNPAISDGATPPPLRAEYEKRRGKKGMAEEKVDE